MMTFHLIFVFKPLAYYHLRTLVASSFLIKIAISDSFHITLFFLHF